MDNIIVATLLYHFGPVLRYSQNVGRKWFFTIFNSRHWSLLYSKVYDWVYIKDIVAFRPVKYFFGMYIYYLLDFTKYNIRWIILPWKGMGLISWTLFLNQMTRIRLCKWIVHFGWCNTFSYVYIVIIRHIISENHNYCVLLTKIYFQTWKFMLFERIFKYEFLCYLNDRLIKKLSYGRV